MKISTSTFKGEIPIRAAYQLGEIFAQLASNTDPSGGGLCSWRALLRIAGLDETDIASLHKYVETSGGHWVVSDNRLDYAPSPIEDDPYERLYFTGETEPRAFANDLVSTPFDRTTDFYKLGVPAPTSVLTIEAGYSTASLYRAYFYTFETAYDEEGPPYLQSIAEITNYGTGNVTLSHFEAPASGRRIASIIVYRINEAGGGNADFQFVSETAIPSFTAYSAVATYNDGNYVSYGTPALLYKCIHDATSGVPPDDPVNGVGGSGTDYWEYFTIVDNVANDDLGDVIISVDWDPPPSGLSGLITVAGGFFAGFSGNRVWLCEPYQPHAWPYSYAFPYQIVGLGSIGTTIVVLTEGFPYLLIGSLPEQMTPYKCAQFYPCVSKDSIAHGNNGVYFASKAGLIFAQADGGMTNVTEKIISTSQWNALAPTTLLGAFQDNKYFGFYSATEGAFIIDFASGSFSRINIYAHAVYNMDPSGNMYIVDYDQFDETNPPDDLPLCIKQWEGDDSNYMYYCWKSPIFMAPSSVNITLGRVLADDAKYQGILAAQAASTAIAVANAAIFTAGTVYGGINEFGFNVRGFNGDTLTCAENVIMDNSITLKLYCDNVLVGTWTGTVGEFIRFAGNFSGKSYYYQIEGYVPVSIVKLVTSIEELQEEL